MTISALRFMSQSHNQRIQAPGGLGGTCVDLANEYLRLCFAMPHIFANAADWIHAVLPGWVWTENAPTNAPEHGDLVVWGQASSVGIGPFGHIALAVFGDASFLLSFDQNWPAGSPCTWVEHTYAGVLGWWGLSLHP